jgi:hypothetical protein
MRQIRAALRDTELIRKEGDLLRFVGEALELFPLPFVLPILFLFPFVFGLGSLFLFRLCLEFLFL